MSNMHKEIWLLALVGHCRLIIEACEYEILSSAVGVQMKQFLIRNHSLRLEEILAPCN